MIKKNLFHKTKASGSDFRILADEELYVVNGGTGSLESEGTEATPEVQCDTSNPGSDEDKLAELASQAVPLAENPVEIPSSNAMNDAMANLEASNKVQSSLSGQESEFKIAERIESQIESLNQANYNAQSGREMMKVPEGQLSSTDDVLRTLKDKVINAVNDTNTEVDRTAIQKEIEAEIAQIDDNALLTFNGKFLDTGARNSPGTVSPSLHVGADVNQRVEISMTDMRTQALNLTGSEGNTLDVTSSPAESNAVKHFDSALQRALNQESSIGATMNRLEFTSNNLTTASENLQSAESTYRDADMAKEMTEFTKNNILMQASTAMLSQANHQNQGVLDLLQ